jgi:hypothetical protein
MADIKKQADLMHILPAQETRLKKMERQLAVPRTEVSSVATSQTTTSASPVALTTADTVTIVTTAVCLIHIYYEVVLSATASGAVTIWWRDHDAANGAGINNEGITITTATPTNVCSTPGGGGTFPPYGGFLTFTNTPKWDTAIGPHTFSLRYSTTAGTATFTNRKLFAWVQPF